MLIIRYLENDNVSESFASALFSIMVILDQKDPVNTAVSMTLLQCVTGKVTLELQQENGKLHKPIGYSFSNSLSNENNIVPIINASGNDLKAHSAVESTFDGFVKKTKLATPATCVSPDILDTDSIGSISASDATVETASSVNTIQANHEMMVIKTELSNTNTLATSVKEQNFIVDF